MTDKPEAGKPAEPGAKVSTKPFAPTTAPVTPVTNTAPPGSFAPDPPAESVSAGTPLAQIVGSIDKPSVIGDNSAEHFGEAGPGAAEVGEDTLLHPGKSHGDQLEPAPLASPRAHKNGRRRLTEAQVAKMNPAELRAVAGDRGYEGVEGGRHAVRTKFLAAQADDDTLEEAVDNPAQSPPPTRLAQTPANIVPAGTPVKP